MSDPQHLDFSDWLQIVAGGILSGIGGAMAWFRGEKKALMARMGKMEDAMQCYDEIVSDHRTDLAVLKTSQENTAERLNEITTTTRDTNEKLNDMQSTLTDVLLAIKNTRRL